MPSFRPVRSAGEAFERSRGILTGKKRLAHVRDVEQSRRRAGMQMFFQDSGRILNGHLIARERHHLRAARHMQRMKRRLQERFVRIGHCGPDQSYDDAPAENRRMHPSVIGT